METASGLVMNVCRSDSSGVAKKSQATIDFGDNLKPQAILADGIARIYVRRVSKSVSEEMHLRIKHLKLHRSHDVIIFVPLWNVNLNYCF